MLRLRAFTLVELLVVMGIIAVLMGILVPTLSGARHSARTVRCAANLRSLGSAVFLYANENRGAAPTCQSIFAGSGTVPWYDQIARYVFNHPVTVTPATIANHPDFERSIVVGCPNFVLTRLPAAIAYNTSPGYGINLLPLGPLTPPDPDQLNLYVDAKVTAKPPRVGRYFKLVEFKNPANRALMADANGFGGLQALDPDPLYYTAPPGFNVKGDIDYYRHGRIKNLTRPGANVVFCDGHVDLCAPWQAWYAVRDPSRRAAGSDHRAP